jgi:uncharacterized phage protein gp47/JayE
MAYSPPQITAAGLSIPSFSDYQDAINNIFLTIYGETNYLGNDASDYQWNTALALKLSDNCSLCQLAYNSRSPVTAVGSALDGVVESNGITRLEASPSTVVLTLVGSVGTIILDGVIADVNGILWDLPSSVEIGAEGTVSVIAVCSQTGPISAAANTVNNPIGGFTSGFTGVTNQYPAVIGNPTETDSQLRARQVVSVALPSSTRLAGTIAEVKAVTGVTRTNIIENQTSVTDSLGNESHSLTCVVEGGVDLDVATAIFDNRGIGCNTQGATATAMTLVPVTDPNSGNITTIGFIRPTYINVYVSLSIHGLNAAYTTATQAAIISSLVTYLNSLQIGEEVTQSALYGIALMAIPNLSAPTFSIRALTLGTSASPTGTSDLSMAFYQVALTQSSHIIITAV